MLRFLRVFVFPDGPAYRQQMVARELERLNYPVYQIYPVQPPVNTSNHNTPYQEMTGNKGGRDQDH